MRKLIFSFILFGLFALFVCKSVNAQTTTAYHASSDAIYAELKSLATQNPSIARIVELSPKSLQGRTILALKISKDVGLVKNKNRILFEGGTHAREWISPEVSLLLARYLVGSYATNATVKSYIDNEEIWIVPLVNPDGYQFTKGSGSNNRMWRKNRRDNGGSCSNSSDGWGVDNNRNYGPKWGGEGASSDCKDETYKGKAAYSEPENQVIRNLLQKYAFTTVVSYHSFSQLVLYPHGWTNSPAPDNALLSAMAKKMSALIKAVHGKTYTPEQASQLYVAVGDASDHAYDVYKIPAFTIELRPTENDTSGFMLPANQIQPTWEENKPAALYLIDLLNLTVQTSTNAIVTVKPGDVVKLTVKGMWRGKQVSNFVVKIGGKPAQVRKATRLAEVSGGIVQNAYALEVTAPANAAGKYDVEVAVGDALAKKAQIVVYSQGTVVPTPTTGSGPTVKPTVKPGPTAKPTTAQPVPSGTCLGSCPTLPAQNDGLTKFAVEISLHGIGNSGDNTNPTLSTFSNKNPLHKTQNAAIYLVNSNKAVVAESSGTITYDTQSGSFKGIIQLGSAISNGIYSIKLKAPYHLPKTVKDIQSVSNSSSYTLPAVHLVAGNTDDDNKLDIIDYTLFLDCFGAQAATNCNDAKKLAADLNDDGIVNQVDYNVFIREMSVQSGS